MIAQIGLSILLLGVMFYAWTEYSRAPAIGLVSMVVAAAGLYFVWLPSHATWLASLSVSAAASISFSMSG